MKNGCIAFLFLLSPFNVWAQSVPSQNLSPIKSMKYGWKQPAGTNHADLSYTLLFEGSAYDLEYLRMDAASLAPSKRKSTLQVPDDEEHLLLIKSGIMSISFGDSSWSIGPGSIALLMPREKYVLQNREAGNALFYLMKYRSIAPADRVRGQTGGGSLVRDWRKLTFIPHDKGGVRRYFQRPTAMCKRFEMHVTTLNPGLKSHEPHTHRAEEIVLLLENHAGSKNETEMQIGEKFFQAEAGDLYYLGSNIPHGIRNIGNTPCSYFAFQFE